MPRTPKTRNSASAHERRHQRFVRPKLPTIAQAKKMAAKAFESYGNGDNRARIPFAAQPRALRIGDQLVCGDYVLAEPKDGYNGSVLIMLTGGLNGHSIEVPSRIPIAIWPNS